ncbi:hypothetical protein VCR15J2_390092 [Vibrio coralliirubri]|uniref:hypothetical protein n=1 Tax=Vibrio coralliirubri TaxID=1516159 RepID=UPI00062EDB07|nr:hypothetical protein [Vibrio coralliirubri]CDT53682.1 hypothetical protein VCR15J2_390092 [Vibrio coralliirubri]
MKLPPEGILWFPSYSAKGTQAFYGYSDEIWASISPKRRAQLCTNKVRMQKNPTYHSRMADFLRRSQDLPEPHVYFDMSKEEWLSLDS